MNKMRRLWRHLRTTKRVGRELFPPPALKAIQATIAQGESLHRAEVRIVIEAALSPAEVIANTSARERACELFSQYRIWDTEENCGVLIYVNLADHKVEIVSDRGVGRAMSAKDWQSICHTMTSGFARGAFQESVVNALEALNRMLQVHFPDTGAGNNQLPNQPLFL